MKDASVVAQTLKNLPAVQETQVRLLSQEDPLDKEMTTHSSTLAWKIPWTEKPGGLQSMGSQQSWTGLNIHACMCRDSYEAAAIPNACRGQALW